MPLPKSLRALRSLATCVAIAAAIATAITPARAAVNLLKNPGFEEPLPGHAWMPTGWDTSRAGLPSVFFGRDTLSPHGGSYSINVANVSTLIPMAFNWNQSLIVGPEAWGKEAVFSIWTRSNGLEGRAYILLQAYRDTASKMAIVWNVDREEALRRLHITPIDDPLLDLGWKRLQFTESETGWVRREVRVFIPPSVNMLFVRAGVLGTGQVGFDDASLTLEPSPPQPELPLHTNLLADPGFEGDGNDWEYSMPPYAGVRVEPDSTVAHTGKRSIVIEGRAGLVESRAGVCQVFANHNIAGKRVRATAWVKTDSLKSGALIKIYAHGMGAANAYPGWQQFSGTTPWTKAVFEQDIPNDTWAVWVWFFDTVPADGRCWFDDLTFEVLGPATGVIGPAPPSSAAETKTDATKLPASTPSSTKSKKTHKP